MFTGVAAELSSVAVDEEVSQRPAEDGGHDTNVAEDQVQRFRQRYMIWEIVVLDVLEIAEVERYGNRCDPELEENERFGATTANTVVDPCAVVIHS